MANILNFIEIARHNEAPPGGWRCRRQADGVLFFHRQTGINVLVDEVIPAAPDRVPRYVQWALLDACNLRCEFCAASKGSRPWKLDAAQRLLKGLDEWGVLEVAFAGGEPLIHVNIVDIIRFVGERTGMAPHLTTNGIWAPPNFVAQVREHLGQVRVSVDGIGAVYEGMRGASFADLEVGLARLKGLRLAFNCLVTAEILTQIPDYFAFAASHGVQDVLFLKPTGPGAALLPIDWRPTLVEAIQRGLEQGFQISTSSAFGVLPELPGYFPSRGCGCGQEFLFITSDRRAKISSTSKTFFNFENIDILRQIYMYQFQSVTDCGCPTPGHDLLRRL